MQYNRTSGAAYCVAGTGCNAGSYAESSTGACTVCSTACTSCTGPLSTDCQSCASGYYLQPAATACSTTCPGGYWPDASKRVCVQCSQNCLTCDQTQADNAHCLACASGLYLSGSQCLLTCPSGTYGNALANACSPCSAQCTTCFGPLANQCYGCKLYNATTYFYYSQQTSCLTVCPAGFINNANTLVCDPCSGCAVTTDS